MMRRDGLGLVMSDAVCELDCICTVAIDLPRDLGSEGQSRSEDTVGCRRIAES